jgi:multicomponent Na+:H+ antiporter subunit B
VLLFLAAAPLVAGVLAWGVAGLPGFGRYPGPYGLLIDRLVMAQRHSTEAVAAVTFDYRGFDTVGEEYILFMAAVGVSVLLRHLRGEPDRAPVGLGEAQSGRAPATSEAVRLAGLLLTAPGVVLGVYVVTHGHLTPGGGFQGGVILASVAFLVYLTAQRLPLSRVLPRGLTEAAHALGAGGFVAVGLAGVLAGLAYLTNRLLPLGTTGQLNSAGFIPIINALVGLEVAAALVLVISEFVQQNQGGQ